MAKAKPELQQVKQLITENPWISNSKIIDTLNLESTMGEEKAVNYVKAVKRRMKASGELVECLAEAENDEERLEDINTLIKHRNGRMTKSAAYFLLLLNCYYRMRSKDDNINWTAIDNTYGLNDTLQNPFSTSEAIKICEVAMERYMDSLDEQKNEEAKKKGFPHAGLSYSPETLYFKLEIRDEELPLLKTIKKPEWY